MDVFVTELQPDTLNVQVLKFGMPIEVLTPTIDVAHTVHYATGYMFKQVQPRLAMATHLSYDEEMVPEMVAGIRTHYDGLFQFGAPDGVIVNVTKKAIWTRKAALAHSTNFARPSAQGSHGTLRHQPTPQDDGGISRIRSTSFRTSKIPATRALEIDAKKYYPPDVYRKPNPIFPKGFKIDIRKMIREKIITKVKGFFGADT